MAELAASDDLAARTPPKGHKGRRVLLAMLGVIGLACGVLGFAYATREIDPKLPNLGQVPAFALIDQDGQRFTEEALRGHPTVINFIFTRCDTICPVIAMKTQRLQDKTQDPRGAGIKMVSITVDPEFDTPSRLTEFGKRYKAEAERWRFLTGPKDKITALITGPLMTTMDRDGDSKPGTPNIVHSGYFLLVDGNLTIRGVYDSNDIHKLDELEHHARFLARTGGGKKFGGGS